MDIPAANFTNTSRQVIDLAYQHAARQRSERVEPEHLLLGILHVKGNLALRTMAALKVDLDQLSRTLEASFAPGQGAAETAPRWEGEGRQVLGYAIKEAQHLGHQQVDALHLLLGLLYEGRGLAYDLLAQFGLSLYELRQYVLQNPGALKAVRAPKARRVPRPSLAFGAILAVLLASGLGLFFNPAQSLIGPLMLVFVVSGWIASVCVHEFGHALAAYLGGDL